MTLAKLLDALQTRGVLLSCDGDTIRYRAPQGVLTDDLRDQVREHKAELLALLRGDSANDTPTPCPTCGDPERWPTDKGPVCVACFIDSITPEPAPAYVKRCEQCGGVNWGPSGDTLGGAEVWHCLRCNPEEQAHE